MKHMKKVLSILLVLCMVITLMPTNLMAEEYVVPATEPVVEETTEIADEATTEVTEDENMVIEEETAEAPVRAQALSRAADVQALGAQTQAVTMDTITKTKSVPLDTSKFYTIFHLDCGRNYFSVQQIKNIIDEMAKDGYNTLELAVGNDALRLVLDDMSVTANGTTYDSTTITNALKSGNSSYRNNGTNELTQSEMDTIISYAKSKNISIIPLVNAPGHANTMLAIMKAVGISNPAYNSDPRTIDVRNAEAVNFSLALVNKYIQYFASKGCKIFNMGADEYANTSYSSGSMGFGHLQSAGEYGYYADYVNNMAAQIQNAGMTAMAFNDGIYFNSKTTSTFDSNIAIAYWTSGWGSYLPMSAANLAAKGHKIINTNDAWYYVIGRDTGDTYSYTTATNGVKNTKVTDIPGSNDPTAYGAMMCAWYDSSATYNESKVLTLISTLAENNASYFVVTPETPDTEEVYEMSDASGKITVNTASQKVNLTSVTAASATVNSVTTDYVAYDVTINGGAYTGAAEVTIPLTDALKNAEKITGFVVNNDASITKVSGTKSTDNSTYSFTAPHFSVVGVMAENDNNADLVEKTITLTVGETKTDVQDGSFPGTYPTENTSIATATVTTGTGAGTPAIDPKTTKVTSVSNGEYILGNGSQWIVLNADGTIGSTTDASQATKWTVTKSGTSYTFKSGDKYLGLGTTTIPGEYTSAGDVRYSVVASSDKDNYTSTNYYHLIDGQYYPVYYTRTTSGGWLGFGATTTYTLYYKNGNNYTQFATGTNGRTTAELYTKGEDTTQTGLVGQTNSYNWSLNSSYGFNNGSNYIRYNNGWTLGSRISSADAFTYTYTPGTDAIPGGSITTASFTGVSEGTTYVTIGNVNYTINVTDKAPAGAYTSSNLTLEYWITNYTVHKTTSSSSASSATIPSSAASSNEGVAVTDYAPEQAYSFFDGTKTVYYWQAMRLDSNNKQTTAANDDETSDGTTFTRVRYHAGAWQYMTKDGKWHYFQSTDQAVAYYMQKTSVTKEVDTMMKDWGWGLSNQDSAEHVMLSVGVVYPDGTLSPSESDIYSQSSTLFNYWSGRDIGIVAPVSNSDYEISKITYTRGTRAGSTTSNKWSSTGSVTWNKTTTAAGSTWYDETVVWDDSMETTPMVNGKVSNITWPSANTGILVLIYLKPVHHDSNLTVNWVDDSTNTTITSQEIVVDYTGNVAPTFISDIYNNGKKGASAGTIDLKDDAYIVNKAGVQQTFNKDLTVMKNIPGQYTSGLYKYVSADISEDGKTLTLHYTMDASKLSNNYVVDFGLGVDVPLSDFGITNTTNISKVTTTSNATYANGNITFTPSAVMKGVETVTVRVEYKSGNPQTLNIGFVPATTVYYEEGFVDFTGSGFSGAAKSTAKQAKQKLGESTDEYGYDAAYADGSVTKTKATSVLSGDKGTFTFTGTGFDLYADCTKTSGNVFVTVKDASGSVKKVASINTASINGSQDYTTYPEGDLLNVPIFSLMDLQHGTYSVTITHVANNNAIAIDGFRVYNTIEESIKFKDDLEDNPTFIEVRDLELGTISLPKDSEKYASEVYKQVYSQISDAQSCTAVLTSKYTDLTDYIDNGPKNEIYLHKGMSLTLNIGTTREVQIGLRGLQTAMNCTIGSFTQSVSTTDMFYTISGKGSTGTVTIANNSKGILAITKLKVCDDPSVIGTVTEDGVMDALYALGYAPDVEMTDANLKINLKDYSGKVLTSTALIANGAEGETATFATADIQAAVENALPTGYALATEIKDASVVYGQNGTVDVQIGKVATLNINYKKGSKVVGTATLTHVQTSKTNKTTFTTAEIKAACPAGYSVISLAGTSVNYGSSKTITGTCR